MPHPATPIYVPDGSISFSGGVSSVKVTTVQSQTNPDGLAHDELAWLINGTIRDGGITPRSGWQPLGIIHDGSSRYQGGEMYQPIDGSDPYFIFSIGGQIYKVLPDDIASSSNLSADFGLTNPSDQTQSYFAQGEEFMVLQAGDSVTLPLFWDGATLSRSKGITNTAVAPGTPGVNELPAATAMTYYMGRMWYAQGRSYSAGDIVRGASGTAAHSFRDAILNVTENSLIVGGDGFSVPSQNGNVRALKPEINLDAALGQGRLLVFTREAVYALSVPVTRNDWIATTNSNQPLQTVVQLTNGSVNDRSLAPVNGDWFYQSLEPSIRTVKSAVRYFNTWGNIDISANVRRVLQFNDRALLRYGSGISFNNRMFQTALPRETAQGFVHDAIVSMDFMPISSFNSQKPPVWEGVNQGLQILQLFVGDFGGRERAFAVIVSTEDNSIQLWEMTFAERFDNIDNRIQMTIETPAWTWGNELLLKELISGELWIDRLYGTVDIQVDYRPDSDNCWHLWNRFNVCSPRNSCETVDEPICYPLTEFGESYRQTLTLPRPNQQECSSATGRPAFIGYQFQMRVTIKGFCRVRGIIAYSSQRERQLYSNPTC